LLLTNGEIYEEKLQGHFSDLISIFGSLRFVGEVKPNCVKLSFRFKQRETNRESDRERYRRQR
jgi:hypothetical protein